MPAAAARSSSAWLTALQRHAWLAGAAYAGQRIAALENLAEQSFALAQMDFQFLFDKSRDQLSIGYNVTDRRRDPSFYDLLASESRLGSFVAIALEQLPQEHWFALGRRLTSAGGRPALLSWSGSMFEYLMPLLMMPTYDGTLLDQTYRAVVQYQIEYGKQHNVPWGISESGYNATDAQLNYQYRDFGVPGLGFKRGLADDLVIAPYATIMSLMIAPEVAAANMERLEAEGFMGGCGFYEAVDYTASRIPNGQTHAVIRSFMAHHEGMSFLALAYVMLDQPMQRRFLADPLLRANILLLQERVPRTAPAYPRSPEMQEPRKEGEPEAPVRTFNTAQTPVPEVHLLSNGRYHVMISNAGSGVSKWNDLALTRWRTDPTRDCWGSYCYIRDLDSGEFWSATYQPTLRKPDSYEAHFPQGRAEFRRQDAEIETRLDIAVSPEADVELRRIAITNRSRRRRRIEVTSYAEVVLAQPGADAAHPAFSNLFVQTQLLPAQQAILCTRRPRSAAERPPFMLHLMTVQGKTAGDATFETDRAKFIGRGRSLASPIALDSGAPLSGSQGPVLDPIVAIRRAIILEEDETAHIDYVTGIADTREAAAALIDKYRDPRLGDRVFEMAWTHSQVVLRQLGASEADAQLFGRLLSSILHPNRLRRADGAILARNRRGQSALWSYGISGDLPIVLLRIGDQAKIELVRQMVQAHAYWRMKGLAVDLVIWNEDHTGYRQALNDQIMGLIAAGPEAHALDRPGGIFIRRLEQITEEDRILFQTVACAIISDSAGTLAEQVGRRPRPVTAIPLLERGARRTTEPQPSAVAPRQLEFFNGLGGMTRDGKEYVITTDRAHPTPAPWSNVIANAHIGTVISESGSAYTYVENAHEYRLTPGPTIRSAIRPAKPSICATKKPAKSGRRLPGRRAAAAPTPPGMGLATAFLSAFTTGCAPSFGFMSPRTRRSNLPFSKLRISRAGREPCRRRVTGNGFWPICAPNRSCTSSLKSMGEQEPFLRATPSTRTSPTASPLSMSPNLIAPSPPTARSSSDATARSFGRRHCSAPSSPGNQARAWILAPPCRFRLNLPRGKSVRLYLCSAPAKESRRPAIWCNVSAMARPLVANWKPSGNSGIARWARCMWRRPTTASTCWPTAGCSIRHLAAACGPAAASINPEARTVFAINCRMPWRWCMPHPCCCANIFCAAPRGSFARETFSTGGIRPPAGGSAPNSPMTFYGFPWPRPVMSPPPATLACSMSASRFWRDALSSRRRNLITIFPFPRRSQPRSMIIASRRLKMACATASMACR